MNHNDLMRISIIGFLITAIFIYTITGVKL